MRVRETDGQTDRETDTARETQRERERERERQRESAREKGTHLLVDREVNLLWLPVPVRHADALSLRLLYHQQCGVNYREIRRATVWSYEIDGRVTLTG